MQKKFLWFYYRTNLLFLVSSCVFSIVLFSCKKKETNVGLNSIESTNRMNSLIVDTFYLETYTVPEDSISSKNPPIAILGAYNDPVFGDFKAGFYTQIRLSAANPNFNLATNPIVIDSFVLNLRFTGYYGKTDPQSFGVYRLSNDLSNHVDSLYYPFSSVSVFPENLIPEEKRIVKPNPTSNAIVSGEPISPSLRLHLDPNLAMQLIEEAENGSGNFASNTEFTNLFKGIFVNVNESALSSGDGAALYFNLNDQLSKLTIYYEQSGSKRLYDFVINTESVKFNAVHVDNSGKKVEEVINNTSKGQTEFYSQAFQSRAVVKMPGINNLDKKSVIHKADLILPVSYFTGSPYVPSPELTVATRLSEEDKTLFSIGVFGQFNFITKSYNIDLKAYLQQIVNGAIENQGILLSPRMFTASADRIIFNGINTENKKKPKLIVTYTSY
jgi:hypothetical protein